MVKELELNRQVFHIIFGIVLVILLKYGILNLERLFIIFLIGVVIALIVRRKKIITINWFLERFERKNALLPGYGVLTYILGTVLVIGLFKLEVALASIMILALGDSFCHLGRFGRIRNPVNHLKFLEGTVIGIITGMIGASFFVGWKVGFFGSLIGMSIEGLDLIIFRNKIDDNLIIPIISGLIMSLF